MDIIQHVCCALTATKNVCMESQLKMYISFMYYVQPDELPEPQEQTVLIYVFYLD